MSFRGRTQKTGDLKLHLKNEGVGFGEVSAQVWSGKPNQTNWFVWFVNTLIKELNPCCDSSIVLKVKKLAIESMKEEKGDSADFSHEF